MDTLSEVLVEPILDLEHLFPVLVLGDQPVSVSDVLRAFRILDDDDQQYILCLARVVNGAKSAV